MRTALSFLAGVLALVAVAVTVPVGWVATHVANEDGYVAFTEPLARDTELRQAVASYLGDEIVSRTGVPQALQPVVTRAISSTAASVSNRDGYIEAWNEVQRRSHRLRFGDPRDLPAEQDGANRFSVDLAPLAAFVLKEIDDELPITLKAPDQLLVPVDGSSDQKVVDAVNDTPGQATGGAIAAVVLAVLALALARRRSVALAWLGGGAAAVAGILKLVGDEAVPRVLERTTAPTKLAGTLRDLLADRAIDSLEVWLVWLAIGGAVALVVGAVTRAVTRG